MGVILIDCAVDLYLQKKTIAPDKLSAAVATTSADWQAQATLESQKLWQKRLVVFAKCNQRAMVE